MQRKKTKLLKTSTPQPLNPSLKIGIVVSSYNSDITFPMRDAAVQTFKDAGLRKISLFEAPGGFEIPIICQKVIKKFKLDGIVAIGCVIRGDTDHYHFIAEASTRGIMDVMLKTGVPIANAILTVNNLKQASDRSQGNMNKGIEAATALLKVLQTI